MRKMLIAAALVSLASCNPAFAADCQWTLDQTLHDLDEARMSHFMVDADKIEAFVATIQPAPVGAVTNVLIAEIRGVLHYGLEIDGCLLPPVPVGDPKGTAI